MVIATNFFFSVERINQSRASRERFAHLLQYNFKIITFKSLVEMKKKETWRKSQ